MKSRCRAIILRRVAYGEADWIVTFFSREGGRISGIARNARASMRRFGGALECGSIVNLAYTRRGGSDLVRIDEASVSVPMWGITRSLERIEGLNRALALALAFLQENDPGPEKFDLLTERIGGLCSEDPGPYGSAAFELRWLALCGYAPSLHRCSVCGRDLFGGFADRSPGLRWRFDFPGGGAVCGACPALGASAHLTPSAAGAFMALSTGGAEPDEASSLEALSLIGGYVEHILGRPLASGRI